MTGANAESDEAKRAGKHPTRDELPDYATAAALGQDPQVAYPEVTAHLASCASCREELEELQMLLTPAYTNQVQPTPTYPQVNLAFLGPRVSAALPSKAWSVDEAGRLLLRFSQSLLDLLRPPTLVGATRGQLLYCYVQEPGAWNDAEVQVEIHAEGLDSETATVRVMVDMPGRTPFEQGGSQVALRVGQASWHGETDQVGSVEFAAIPQALLPQLEVEISPPLGE